MSYQGIRTFAVGQARRFLEQFSDVELELVSKAGLWRPANFLSDLKGQLADGAESAQQFFWQTPKDPQICLSFTFSEDSPDLELDGLRSESLLPCIAYHCAVLSGQTGCHEYEC